MKTVSFKMPIVTAILEGTLITGPTEMIQSHIEHLLQEITNLPPPWSYSVDIDGRIFFIK